MPLVAEPYFNFARACKNFCRFALLFLILTEAHAQDISTKKYQGFANSSRLIAREEKPIGTDKPVPSATRPWITISYGGLVEGSTITHSGETIDQVVQKIREDDESLKGLVQPYLEPFSFLCHDVLLSLTAPDSFPALNILSHYPTGSAQPTWASLFQEGHFQLFYNPHIIRLFLKGNNPEQSFRPYQAVVRHALLDVLERYPDSIKNLEVYAFTHDYARMEIHFNSVPAIFPIKTLDLSARKKPVDLASIEDFLKEGVILEAVEVDADNNLFFFGRKAPQQTIAGFPISLSDMAVLYRSVFHYGHNPPYISLDKHEDNRLAKVNFGGHLENTRVGHVVLEADKLFKTLGTGLDPNTHENIRWRMARSVPGFLTQDERSLLEDRTMGHTRIRYWFYPDSIGTVTDGSLGAILTHRFLADVERMDMKVNVSSAIRKTIDHLNRHFADYENADNIYRELSTVGRIMALMNWLRGMNIHQRIELEDFLSVPLPAFSTPLDTRKMLAITTGAYSQDSPPSFENIRSRSEVFYLSHLLEEYGPRTKDEQFVEMAKRSVPDISDLVFPRLKNLKATINEYDTLIKQNEATISSLGRDIERRRYALDRTNALEVDAFNTLVNQSNQLIEMQKRDIEIYNDAVRELNQIDVQTRQIVSIGGGVNLNPQEFKIISHDVTSPRIREINTLKKSMKTVGKIARSGDWVRSLRVGSSSRQNLMPKGQWASSKLNHGQILHTFRSGPGASLSSSLLGNNDEWEANVTVNDNEHALRFSRTTGLMRVKDPILRGEVTGQLSSDKKRVVFSKW